MQPSSLLTRRSVLMLTTGVALTTGIAAIAVTRGRAADAPVADGELVTVHKHPKCGCCMGWVAHLEEAGFTVKVGETKNLEAVKKRLGVPAELISCHTAQVAGYILEGHVPAVALKRLLNEKPDAVGLAVPGMPLGSPGMEGSKPEKFDVVLFGPNVRRTYMTFVGEQPV
jgi:hypothetical protein